MLKRTMIALTGAAAIGAGFAGSAAADALLVEDFESPDITGQTFDAYNQGETLGSFEVVDGQVELLEAGFDLGNSLDTDGQFIDTFGIKPGKIRSTPLTLKADTIVDLAFDLIPHKDSTRASTVKVRVEFGNSDVTLLDKVYKINNANTMGASNQNESESFTILSDLDDVFLSFSTFGFDEPINEDNVGPFLDNVSVHETPISVPEPASLLGLATIGAVAAGGALKRKAAA